MNTPDPTPRKITPEDPPQFSPETGFCLFFDIDSKLWIRLDRVHYSKWGARMSHWLPDQPTAPTCVPDAPAAPTPEAALKYNGPHQYEKDLAWLLAHEGNSIEETVAEIVALNARHAPSPAVGQPSDTEMLAYAQKIGRFNDRNNTFTLHFPINTLKLHTLVEAITAAMQADKQGRGEG